MGTQNNALSKKEIAEQTAKHNREVNERLDNGYDGYYDDIKPKESHSRVQEFNKETAKKIAIIIGVSLVLIAFSIVLIKI